jgi:acetyl-CoA acetyltransferase
MKDVVIIDGLRTPYAKAGTAFKDVPAVDLGAAVMKELIARTGIDKDMIDEVIVGNAGMPAEAANIARVIALRAGLPERIPAYSVQRNCASGMQAAASAYTQILAGMRSSTRRRRGIHVELQLPDVEEAPERDHRGPEIKDFQPGRQGLSPAPAA